MFACQNGTNENANNNNYQLLEYRDESGTLYIALYCTSTSDYYMNFDEAFKFCYVRQMTLLTANLQSKEGLLSLVEQCGSGELQYFFLCLNFELLVPLGLMIHSIKN